MDKQDFSTGVRKRMEEIMEMRRRVVPWWYSGANCLAAISWLAFFALIFLTLLGYIERDKVAGFMAALIFLIAWGATAIGIQRNKK